MTMTTEGSNGAQGLAAWDEGFPRLPDDGVPHPNEGEWAPAPETKRKDSERGREADRNADWYETNGSGWDATGGRDGDFGFRKLVARATTGSAQRFRNRRSQKPGSLPSMSIPYRFRGSRFNLDVIDRGGMPRRFFFGSVDELDRDRKKAIAMVAPAVPQVLVRGTNGQEWSGSSTILNPDDVARYLPHLKLKPGQYVVHTNHHVASGAKRIILATADGQQELEAKVVRAPNGASLLDERDDTALLIVTSPTPLPTARIGEADTLEMGDTVFTAGYPLGLPRIAVTTGIVSQPAQLTGGGRPDIQSDAAINPGNSGGPLFTRDGIVVGTNTYTFQGANDMSFVIPITHQLATLAEIWERGYVERGSLGIAFAPFGRFDRKAPGLPTNVTGATIDAVDAKSMAAKAGLKRGDLVSAIRVLDNGIVVRRIALNYASPHHGTRVAAAIASLKPGQQVELICYRRKMDLGSVSYEADQVRMNVVQDQPPKEDRARAVA